MFGLGGSSCLFTFVVEERLVSARGSVNIYIFSKYCCMLFWSFSADEDMPLTRTARFTTFVLGSVFFGGALRLGKVGDFCTIDY